MEVLWVGPLVHAVDKRYCGYRASSEDQIGDAAILAGFVAVNRHSYSVGDNEDAAAGPLEMKEYRGSLGVSFEEVAVEFLKAQAETLLGFDHPAKGTVNVLEEVGQ